jgi:hypothetical protein
MCSIEKNSQFRKLIPKLNRRTNPILEAGDEEKYKGKMRSEANTDISGSKNNLKLWNTPYYFVQNCCKVRLIWKLNSRLNSYSESKTEFLDDNKL